MKFYLGTHEPLWLREMGIPLFVPYPRIVYRLWKKPLFRAACEWAMDSGGFSEIAKHGRWTIPPADYVAGVRRIMAEMGGLAWAAIQDWMCEPAMLRKTGLSIPEHQERTVRSYADLLTLAPEIPWAPVLQGFEEDDYLRCLELYEKRGLPIRQAKIVGVGTVCRRQGTKEATQIIRRLAAFGLPIHAFGFKENGLYETHSLIASSDSLAWSLHARKRPPLPGHEGLHKSCQNCMLYATWWRTRLLLRIGDGGVP